MLAREAQTHPPLPFLFRSFHIDALATRLIDALSFSLFLSLVASSQLTTSRRKTSARRSAGGTPSGACNVARARARARTTNTVSGRSSSWLLSHRGGPSQHPRQARGDRTRRCCARFDEIQNRRSRRDSARGTPRRRGELSMFIADESLRPASSFSD